MEFNKDENKKKKAIEDTKPHTLRSIFARSVTLNDRLYIFHNLCPKDDSLSKELVKTPIRVMDFKMKRIFKVEFVNDDR